MSIQPTTTTAASSSLSLAKEEAKEPLGLRIIKNLRFEPRNSDFDFKTKLGRTTFLVKVEVPKEKNQDGEAPYVTLRIGEMQAGHLMKDSNTVGIRLVKGQGSGEQDDIEVVKLEGPEPAPTHERFTYTDAAKRHSLTHEEVTDKLAIRLENAPLAQSGNDLGQGFAPFASLLNKIGEALGVPENNRMSSTEVEGLIIRTAEDGVTGSRRERSITRQGGGSPETSDVKPGALRQNAGKLAQAPVSEKPVPGKKDT